MEIDVAVADFEFRAMTLWKNARKKRWSLLLSACLASIAFFLLASASANTLFSERYYFPLLVLNAALIVILMIAVGHQVYVLWRSRQRSVFGSRLAVRLTLICSLVALLPGVLVYAVSVQFIGRSVESWFDVRVDRALEGGMNVSRTTLNTRLSDTVAKGQRIVAEFRESPLHYGTILNRAADQVGVDEAALFSAAGVLIAVGGTRPSLSAPAPSRDIFQQLRMQSIYTSIDQDQEGLRLRVILPIEFSNPTEPARYLQVIDAVPTSLAYDIETVQNGWRDYKEISFSRQDVKYLYMLTLTMALLLTLTIALGMAIMLAERFAAPLGLLAAGTRAVAEGDFSVRQPVASHDEMGTLTESFNAMTMQLEQAQEERECSHRALETARAYLENVLVNLSSGVIVFDETQHVRTVNQSAAIILQKPLANLENIALSQWHTHAPDLAPFAEVILQHLETPGQWHQELSVLIHQTMRSLLIRGTKLADPLVGHVIVFDDVTVIVQAQRDAAWSEVARRLAHEIKNPLTPIQLSAERLTKKLTDKLPEEDRIFLERGVQTIVSQVSAMKHMVDDFAVYARQPRPGQLVDVDLAALLKEVLDLYDHLRPNIHFHAPEKPFIIRGEPVRLRQIFHNLLQNAEDAQDDCADPRYDITLEGKGLEAIITFSDHGAGFPDAVLRRAFEPYITTKAKGTGLGLAIVKKIVEEHDGQVFLANRQPQGGVITLIFPLPV
ncbi:MAG: HAMP domain-containing protein [Burkholderiales bacterium]|jgi:nitrogen fixation/metabolism regulation signal transduction histidine kinase|nr:HAMP domain-containing protein [Burkholderiales bacterium]